MSETVLQVSHLRQRIGKREVLKDVSFSLEAGTAAALVGPEGAGKSTLVRVLAGLLLPTEGTVSLLGSRTGRELRKARRQTGFMLPSPFGYETLSVEKNLNNRARLYGRLDKARIQELKEELHLTEKYRIGRKEQLKLLSVGETGRYSLACALVNSPRLLILDEPLVGVDNDNGVMIADLLNRLREEGTTLLITGESAVPLGEICSQVLLLEEGVLGAPVPMEEALAEEAAKAPPEE